MWLCGSLMCYTDDEEEMSEKCDETSYHGPSKQHISIQQNTVLELENTSVFPIVLLGGAARTRAGAYF